MRREKMEEERRRRCAEMVSRYGEVGRHACGRKFAYRTKAEALVVADKCIRRGEQSHLRAYRCTFCGKWHLTSKW